MLVKTKLLTFKYLTWIICPLIILFSYQISSAQDQQQLVNKLIIQSENTHYLNLDSALLYADSALKIAENIDYTLGIAKAKKQQALIKYFEVRFTDALNLSIESYELFKSVKNTKGQASALNLTAVIYSDQGKSQEALLIYNQILQLIDYENYQRRAATLNNIGVTYKELGNIEKCYEYYLKGFNTIKNRGELEDESQYSNNLASIFIAIENADSAQFYANYGLKLALEIDNNHRIANSYETLGDYYYWQQDFKSALKYYMLAFKFANKIGIVYEISSTASGLSKTYSELRDYRKAYEYLLIQKRMDDSIKQREIASHITQIELEKVFQKERELNEAINEKNRLVRNIYFIIIIAIVIISCIIYYSFHQKKRSYTQLKTHSEKMLLQKQEIEQQAKELSKLGSIKDKLFSIISHDLRSPLTSLVSLLNIVKSENLTKEEFNKLLNETVENVNYATTMVDNLLNWATSQQNGMQSYPSNVLLNQIVQNEIHHFGNQLNNKNITINNSIDNDLLAFADDSMLQIVVRNLISNAIKFSNFDSEIHVAARKINQDIQLEIHDSGKGMTKETQQNLFQSIVESERGTNNEKGTGLGLILCKDLIELNNGSISFKSTEGKGSTFIITIPQSK
ncbi:MAG: tetratricopeptide repeat-containing sensor histidine kinase [Bacteroidetes bacterium]|nr:tetratricopeptide repeat-containing sensor histidine kinase [Bacteroidota bacterium]